jgi:hypothetical protein
MGNYNFVPIYKTRDYTWLTCGAIMVIAGACTFVKVYKGSKNIFCYTMQIFTVAFGLTNISFFLSDTFIKPVQLQDRMHYFSNENWLDTTYFVYYTLTLLSWFFAM